MIACDESADTSWAFTLAEHGASPRTVAACCGRTRKWAKKLVEAAGGDTTKRTTVNWARAFQRDPYRKAHAHVVLRAHFTLGAAIRAPERLALLYRAYRATVGAAILTIDEVYELIFNLLEERGADKRTCSQCNQQWYLVGESCLICPGCEAVEVYVCSKCNREIKRDVPRRGRPPRHCDDCRVVRTRAPPPGASRGEDRQLRLVGLTSPGGNASPTAPP